MTRVGVCERFPNTIVLAGARKVRFGGIRLQRRRRGAVVRRGREVFGRITV